MPTWLVRGLSGANDVEERASVKVKFNSADLELVDDANKLDQIVGFRFNGLEIPQGASVVNGHLKVQVYAIDAGATSLQIHGEDADNAQMLSNTNFAASSRQKITATAAAWTPTAWITVGEAQQTADISSISQEILTREGWVANDSIALIVTGSGEREAEYYDGDAFTTPLLHVKWPRPSDSPTSSVSDSDFADTEGPNSTLLSSGSTGEDWVSEDTPSVTTDKDDYAPGETATITTTGFDVGASVTFEVDHISNAGSDGIFGTVDDTIVELGGKGHDPWTVTDGGDGDLDKAANGTISTQWYVNPDDSLNERFLLTATDTATNLVASTSFTDAPTVVESRISSSADDVEERASGSISFTSSDLELVDDNPSKPGQTIGLRFNGLDIPQGAIITSAYIQFQVDEVSTGAATLQIQGEDVDNASAFTNTAFDVSSRLAPATATM